MAAASSLTDAVEEVAGVYREETGVRVEFTFGGSNTLARQVELGAPADAVVFAGPLPVDRLAAAGRLVDDTRTTVLTNQLVVIGEPDVAASSGSSQLTELAALADTGGRVAIADPQLAPAGRYATQAFEAAGILAQIEPRLVPTLDVRAAVGAVDAGAVRYGVVYATDAAASGVNILLTVSAALYDPIEYPAAVVAGTGDEDRAAAFIDFLSGETARAIFARHGFSTP